MIQPGWKALFEQENQQTYFQELKQFLNQEYASKTVFPPKGEIVTAFETTDLDEVKVVIVGQDPYPALHQAHGLCFSVRKGVPIPKSLKNIYKELENDVGFICPQHGDLTKWAKQGVLLLNTTLTVVAGQPMSHANRGWEIFTKKVIQTVNDHPSTKVFFLWGRHAQSLEKLIDNPVHCILKTVHPSPLSAYQGFFGCRHFSKANTFLSEHGRKPIDWQL